MAPSFIAQSGQWIDARSSARGNPACGQSDCHDHDHHRGQCQWIGWRDSEQIRLQAGSQREGDNEAEPDADGGETQAVSENQSKNIAALRTHRHADGDFRPSGTRRQRRSGIQ